MVRRSQRRVDWAGELYEVRSKGVFRAHGKKLFPVPAKLQQCGQAGGFWRQRTGCCAVVPEGFGGDVVGDSKGVFSEAF